MLGCGEKMVVAVAVSFDTRPNSFPTNCRITTLEGFKPEPFDESMEFYGEKVPLLSKATD